ncbi:uncharacterized protein VTP21DRAFT_1323 [Calcarisporiella thermophila]|uniref:uncharacterized protein n=1 Tax=Calcarisporiella thermophila TaxID=911321 RepID=UPI00374483FF
MGIICYECNEDVGTLPEYYAHVEERHQLGKDPYHCLRCGQGMASMHEASLHRCIDKEEEARKKKEEEEKKKKEEEESEESEEEKNELEVDPWSSCCTIL